VKTSIGMDIHLQSNDAVFACFMQRLAATVPLSWLSANDLKSTEACTVSPTTQLPTAPKAPGWLIAASLLSVYVIWGTTYFAI
jgi:hypothetical protein